jgi:hypothetical protein
MQRVNLDNSEGRVPERLIEESLLEVSHCTPIQSVQKPLEDTLDQPDGKGFRELASFSVTATSSAVTDERMRKRRQ